MKNNSLVLFTLNASKELGNRVADRLELALSPHEEREFEDGEYKTRSLINVRGKDCYVIQSLNSEPSQSVHDKLCRLLFFISGLKDAGAKRVTASRTACFCVAFIAVKPALSSTLAPAGRAPLMKL